MKKISLEHVAFQLLKQNGLRVSKQYLRKRIITHPHFPSLLAVSETFDAMKIPNAVVEVSREKYHEIPLPFMAHVIDAGHESFKLISDHKLAEKSFPGDQHSGIVLVIDPSDNLHLTEEHSSLLRKEILRRKKIATTAVVLLTCLLVALLQHPTALAIGAALFNTAGLMFSFLIQSQKFGAENPLASKFCNPDKGFDCDKVINSKTIQFPGGIDWADLALIFFTGNLIAIWMTCLTGIFDRFLPVLAVVSLLPLPFTILSLYYQVYVLKQWCTLCLAISGLSWIQFALIAPAFTTTIPLTPLFLQMMILVSVFCAWLVAKPELISLVRTRTENLKLLRFKQNPAVFQSLLNSQPSVNTGRFNFDIEIGNPEGETKIVVVCSPFCNPCAQAHAILDELLEENPLAVSLTVRLLGNFKNTEDKGTLAAKRIIQTICAHPNPGTSFKRNKSILADWFLLMNQEQFNAKYPLDHPGNVDHILNSYLEWAFQSGISFTPAIFINGKLLPKEYSPHELKFLLANKGESPVP